MGWGLLGGWDWGGDGGELGKWDRVLSWLFVKALGV